MTFDSQTPLSPKCSVSNCPPPPPSPYPLSSNSFPLTLLADPHPLNPVVSIFYKNIGGRGLAPSSTSQLSTSSIHPLCFLNFMHSVMRRALHNSFGINSFHTLSVATGVYPPIAGSHSPKLRLGGRRIDGRAS